MRPIPWLIRTGLFAVGFGVGLSHYKSTPPQQPVVIELQIIMPDSSKRLSPHNPLPQVSFTGEADRLGPVPLDLHLLESNSRN